MIRDEFKVRIYSEYFLNANRFILSIHDLNTTQIKRLEDLTHRHLKKWFGIPQGGSWCLVHEGHGLNIKSISHLYKESRTLSLANMRYYSDAHVRHALESKENREAEWKKKYSSY